MDVTLRSALTRDGEAQPGAADEDGVVLERAREDKERAYPELTASNRCRLVVLGIETGGRWSDKAVMAIWQLTLVKAQESPAFMRRAVALMWQRRWTRMLAVSCATAFASSLVENGWRALVEVHLVSIHSKF